MSPELEGYNGKESLSRLGESFSEGFFGLSASNMQQVLLLLGFTGASSLSCTKLLIEFMNFDE